MIKSNRHFASMLTGRHCKDCGWPVVDAFCNDEFLGLEDSSEWDYWNYCSNKGCVNHEGEGVSNDKPEWVSNFNL